MRRLGSARTIIGVETLVLAARASQQEFQWKAHGVECTRTSHRHSGPDHSLSLDVLTLHHRGAGPAWRLIIVSELWRAGSVDLRAARWLKLISGRAEDVSRWLARNGNAAPIDSTQTEDPTP
jgi:hypothetical protein